MITNDGKLAIKRYFGGQAGSIAGTIAFGVGNTAAAVTDKSLRYEVVRKPVTSVSADLDNDRIIFKTVLAPNEISTVYEVGLYSDAASGTPSRLFNSFVLGNWSNATLTATNARASTQALKIDYVASGTTNAESTNFVEDLSAFSDTSTVAIAFHATTNLSSVRVRMGTNATNYFEFVLSSPTLNGYNIYKVARSTATKIGTPSWDNITYLAVRPSATAGGAGSIYFDGIRFEGGVEADSLLVARTVLATPAVIDTVLENEVEYNLGISFT